MRTKTILLVILFSISINLFSQEDFMKFGEINNAEYYTVYPQDTSVSAIVIGEWGYNTFSAVSGSFEYHIRIKIIKESAFNKAEVKISYPRDGGISKIKGMTYNYENGTITKSKLSNDNIFDTKSDDNTYIKSFALPNVKIGSVIEYSYKVDGSRPHTWHFQQDIPVLKSEFDLEVPEYINYNFACQNCEKVAYLVKHITHETQMKVATWVATNLIPITDEPFTKNNFDDKVSLEYEYVNYVIPGYFDNNAKNYYEYCNNLLDIKSKFGDDIKNIGYVKKTVQSITTDTDSSYAKMKKIYDYVKNNFMWNGNNAVSSFFGLQYSFNQKRGSVADINLNLLKMLRSAKIECYPVFLSTRNNRNIYKDNMLLSRFNYTIVDVFINNKEYLLDATEPFLKVDELPFRCLNGSGLIIKENSEMWVDLLRNEKFESKHIYNYSINANMQIEGDAKVILDGISANTERKSIKNTNIEQYIENKKKNFSTKQLSNYTVLNENDPDKKLELSYNFINNETLVQTNDSLYISTMFSDNSEKNPFESVERHSPVNFGCPQRKTIMINVKIPQGYFVARLPKAARVELPNNSGTFSYSINSDETKVTILSRLAINKSEFSVDEYQFLKEFYDHIINNQAQQIVLKKQ